MEEAFPTYRKRIDEIREAEIYKRQAKSVGWLEFAPQVAGNLY